LSEMTNEDAGRGGAGEAVPLNGPSGEKNREVALAAPEVGGVSMVLEVLGAAEAVFREYAEHHGREAALEEHVTRRAERVRKRDRNTEMAAKCRLARAGLEAVLHGVSEVRDRRPKREIPDVYLGFVAGFRCGEAHGAHAEGLRRGADPDQPSPPDAEAALALFRAQIAKGIDVASG
jgi:hypothetical protein